MPLITQLIKFHLTDVPNFPLSVSESRNLHPLSLLYAIALMAFTATIISSSLFHFCSSYMIYFIYHQHSFLSREHVNPQLTCSQSQWLHSSVGRASHRYREVTGSNPVEVLNFFSFSGFFTQLQKLRSLRRSFFFCLFVIIVNFSWPIANPFKCLVLLSITFLFNRLNWGVMS